MIALLSSLSSFSLRDSMNVHEPSLQPAFEALVMASLIAGLLALVALILQRLIAGRVSVRVVGMLWMLVLIRFLLLAVPESPTSFLNLIPTADSPMVGALDEEFGKIEISTADEFAEIETLEIMPQALEPLNVSAAVPSNSLPSPLYVAGLVWLVGVVWLMLMLCIRFARVQRILGRSTVPCNEVQVLFAQCKSRVGVARRVRLRITTDLETPAMTGVLRPVVLLPEWVPQDLTPEQLEMILVHEIVHVQKWDGVVLLMSYFVKVLHWFNPLVHIVIGRIDACRELACDQQVLRLMGNEEEQSRRYGQTILHVAERVGGRRNKLRATGLGLVGGFIGNDNNLVKQRIAMLMKTGQPRRLGTAFCIASMFVLVAAGFTAAQTSENPKDSAADSTVESAAVALTEQQEVEPATVGKKPIEQEQDKDVEKGAEEVDEKVLKANLPGGKAAEIDFDASVPCEVELGSALKLNFEFRIPELMVVDPDSIRVWALAPSQIEVKGLEVGVTSFIVTAEDKEQHQVTVCVTHPQADDGGGSAPVEHLEENERLRELANKALKASVGNVAPEDGKSYSMPVGTSRRYECEFRIPELAVKTPQVATVTPVSPTEFLVTATKPGTTSVTIMGENGEEREIQIVAVPDIRKLQRALSMRFPGMQIKAKAVGESAVALSGTVPDKEQIENIVAVAMDFFPNVVHELKHEKARDKFIAFQVKVYEVDTKKFQALGVDWKALGAQGKDISCFGDLLNSLPPQSKTKPTHAMVKTIGKNNQLGPLLEGLERNAVVKLMDQPVLVVEPDRLAEFFAGEELPINRDGEVEFVEIGIKLNIATRFAPTESDKQRLVVEVRAEVSEIANDLSGDTGVPGFRVRRVNSGVYASPGESIAIVLKNSSANDEKGKEIVFLATPRMIKNARVRANPAFNAKRSDADLMFDSPNDEVRR